MLDAHEETLPRDEKGRPAGMLLSEAHGALNGFCLGIAYYDGEEYGPPGVHADQEGFFVLEGTGTAEINGREFKIRPGSAFIAPKGAPHKMKRDRASQPVKVLWMHSPA